ncbi:MAG: 2Fe-2S iron-sulfur cluster-binding protein [Candidatus Alcyoniella australis]|nr:2Fe-2S iron-sulfur cluster-binding protein [Candidatus Alcyoniella australis]
MDSTPQKVKVTINGRSIEVEQDTTIVQAAEQLRIHIPTLCYNENLAPYGVCRVCMVEIDDGRRKRMVPSCAFPIRREISVSTNNERVRRIRRSVLQLLLARCPNEPVVKKLAAEYGVDAPHPRMLIKDDDCILCGLCVRTCQQIVGVAAIGFEGRGYERRVVPPYDEQNSQCLACGACAYVCPTQCIDFSTSGDLHKLERWHRDLDVSKLPEAERGRYNAFLGNFFKDKM